MVFPVVGGTQSTGYEISNSLRFNSSDDSELTKTFGSAGGDTWSYSCWVKRSDISEQGHGLLKANSIVNISWQTAVLIGPIIAAQLLLIYSFYILIEFILLLLHSLTYQLILQ